MLSNILYKSLLTFPGILGYINSIKTRQKESNMDTLDTGLDLEGLEGLSLGELFSLADEIGTKYQTDEEVLEYRTKLEEAKSVGFDLENDLD